MADNPKDNLLTEKSTNPVKTNTEQQPKLLTERLSNGKDT